jgi:hypothetical protein
MVYLRLLNKQLKRHHNNIIKMEDLKKQLFNLAVIHGVKNCYAALDSLRDTIRAHAQFLMEEFNSVEKEPESPVIEEKHEEIKTEASEEKTEQITVVEEQVVDTSVKVVKKKKGEIVSDDPPKGNAKKRWQREQEGLKRVELQSRGIFKKDVLTIENVTAWIKAGRSYAVIAREEVGCTEEEVSRFCKKHKLTNIQ